ncbi:MAG: flagellar biosynthesis protein FliQ [Synergistetes bacterium]|nr:MAG: Flagellar biosynthetic protein FliQ [bacterium 42_11]MBC7331003.1 flagellar biosynthesis protein FliQ [Synergistota bacterium]MDK2871606.1 flagellar biosynthesis protein FliQ [bacterium]
MTDALAIEIFRKALFTALLVAAPMLGVALIVGIVVSVIQTATSIQEQTLTFIPKIIAVLFSIIYFGPWMLRLVVDFTVALWSSFPYLIR